LTAAQPPAKLERMRTQLPLALALGTLLAIAGVLPLGAQDRLFLFDRELSTQPGQLGAFVAPAPPFGDDVTLYGSRFVARLQWDPALGDHVRYLHVTDMRTGGQLALRSLTVPITLPMPVLVPDPSRLRVFVWYERTVASVDASALAWRPITTATAAELSPTQGRTRAIAYASGLDALVLVRAAAGGGAELVWVRAADGALLQIVPLARAWTALAVTADGTRAFGLADDPARPFGQVLHAVDRATGQMASLTNAPGLDGVWSLTLNEVTGRLITRGSTLATQDTLFGFDLTPAHRWTLQVPGAAGLTFAANRGGAGFLVPYVAPQPLPLQRFDVASGTVTEVADVTARAGLTPGNYLLLMLSPPRAPSSLTATVSGRDVTLTWPRTDDATSYVVDAFQGASRVHVYSGQFDGGPVFAPGVPPGAYYVRVRALNDIGVSGFSPETLVVVP